MSLSAASRERSTRPISKRSDVSAGRSIVALVLFQGAVLAKEDLIEFDGVVIELLPDARFRVRLDNGHETLAYTSGKMKKHRIRVLVGDRVTVEMTPYDMERGRLSFRHKDQRQPTGSSAGAQHARAPRP